MDSRATRYRFSGFELDLAGYELSRAGRQVPLEKIPFDLLTLLLERRGEVVTRDEIATRIWAGSTMVDIENGINTAIRKLRLALEDDPQNPRFIQTVVGRGYRFVDVTAQAIQGNASVAAAKGNSSRWLWALSVVLLVVAAGFWLAGTRTGGPDGPVMIAVLPFTNLSPNLAEKYFADGITADIITQLGRSGAERVGVIAHTSVMRFADTKTPIRQIAEQLGVEFVLEGNVRREGQVVRVGAQLIRARDESHVWAKNYDRELSSILAIQNEVAVEAADEVRSRIIRTSAAKTQRQVVPEAYDLYLQGRFHLNRRTEDDLRKAIGFFEAAISRDPAYAATHAGLADSYSSLGYSTYAAPTEAFSKARIAARRALELDPSSAQAHAALGYVEMYFDWDFRSARRRLQTSIEIDPSYAAAHEWLGILLTAEQEFDAAREELQRARRLDPLSPGIMTNLGFAQHYSGQNDEALEVLRGALRLSPGFPLAQFWMARVYVTMDNCTEALVAFDAGSKSLSAWQPMLAARGNAYGVCGKRTEAEKILADLHSLAKTRFVTSYGVALVHAGLGQNEDVLAWLRKAFDERSHWLVWLELDPRWKQVRQNPQFVAIKREVFRHR